MAGVKCDNKRECLCQEKSCERNGKCCECVAYHREMGNFPGCMRDNLKKIGNAAK